MERIEFTGRSELRLAGTLCHADSACAVVMVHGFMGDKTAHGLFPEAAEALRKRGWSSLCFDLSGCGESDDNCLSLQAALDDVQSAIELMRSMCYRHIALWGHGLGSRLCLESPKGIDSMVLSDAFLGRVQVDWKTHFSPAELDGLRSPSNTLHAMRTGIRKRFSVHKSMLDYFADFEPGKVLARVRCPVLVMHSARFVDATGQTESLRALMRLLPQHSEHALVPGSRQSVAESASKAAELGARWIERNGVPRVQRWR